MRVNSKLSLSECLFDENFSSSSKLYIWILCINRERKENQGWQLLPMDLSYLHQEAHRDPKELRYLTRQVTPSHTYYLNVCHDQKYWSHVLLYVYSISCKEYTISRYQKFGVKYYSRMIYSPLHQLQWYSDTEPSSSKIGSTSQYCIYILTFWHQCKISKCVVSYEFFCKCCWL